MHVYAIGIEGGLVKIGLANNPRKRLVSMQTGCPQELTLLATKRFKTRAEAEKEEKRIHAELAHLRQRGEWFRASLELLGPFFSDVSAPAKREQRRDWYMRSIPELSEQTRHLLFQFHGVASNEALIAHLAG